MKNFPAITRLNPTSATPTMPDNSFALSDSGLDLSALTQPRRRQPTRTPAVTFSERGAMLLPLLGLAACGGGGTPATPGPVITPPSAAPDTAAITAAVATAPAAIVTGNVITNDVPNTATVATVGGTAIAAGGTNIGTSALGTLNINSAGAFTFTADGAGAAALRPGGTGSASYNYTNSSGQSATLTVTVTGVNDAPVAGGPASVAVGANGSVKALTGFVPTDPDGDTLTITVTAVPTGPGASLSLTSGGAPLAVGQKLTVTEFSNLFVQVGALGSTPGTFGYSVSDGTLSVTKTVTIGVALPSIDLNSLSATQGTIFTGAAGSGFGAAIAGGVDINGDGKIDFIVGAPNAANGSISIYSNNGAGGTPVVVNGASSGDRFGAAIAVSPTNIGGSATADLVVGAPGAVGIAAGTNQGAAYIIFGGSALALPDGLTATNGFVFLGSEGGTAFTGANQAGQDVGTNVGYYVSALGDVGGGAQGDFFVGIPGQERPTLLGSGNDGGLSVLGFGQASYNATYNISSYGQNTGATNFTNGGVLKGGDTLEEAFSGPAVSGNFSGAATLDVAIASPYRDLNTINDRGSVTLSIDGLGGLGTNLDGAGNTGRIQIIGSANGDLLGSSIAFGNVDGVGGDDLIIGASGSDLGGANSGAVYIIHDLSSFTASTTSLIVDLSSLLWSGNAITLSGGLTISRIAGSAAGEGFGASVAFVGNYDGTAGDFAVGTNGGSGDAYVINGGNAAAIGTRPTATPDGINVTRLDGPAATGTVVVTGLGDINGGGAADIGVGIAGANKAYIVYGNNGIGGTALSATDTGVSYASGASVDAVINHFAGPAAATPAASLAGAADHGIALPLDLLHTLHISTMA